MYIYIKIEIRNLNLRGDLNNFLASGISYSIMFGHFCLASKMKIEIIEAKHQTCFIIV